MFSALFAAQVYDSTDMFSMGLKCSFDSLINFFYPACSPQLNLKGILNCELPLYYRIFDFFRLSLDCCWSSDHTPRKRDVEHRQSHILFNFTRLLSLQFFSACHHSRLPSGNCNMFFTHAVCITKFPNVHIQQAQTTQTSHCRKITFSYVSLRRFFSLIKIRQRIVSYLFMTYGNRALTQASSTRSVPP